MQKFMKSAGQLSSEIKKFSWKSFLRTSVDHGTAFDIAGKGIASAVSMQEAIRLAAQYGKSYKSNR